jgi:hypothetical protein
MEDTPSDTQVCARERCHLGPDKSFVRNPDDTARMCASDP